MVVISQVRWKMPVLTRFSSKLNLFKKAGGCFSFEFTFNKEFSFKFLNKNFNFGWVIQKSKSGMWINAPAILLKAHNSKARHSKLLQLQEPWKVFTVQRTVCHLIKLSVIRTSSVSDRKVFYCSCLFRKTRTEVQTSERRIKQIEAQHLTVSWGKQGEADSCRVKMMSFHPSSFCVSVCFIQLGDPPMSCTSGSNRTCSHTNTLKHTWRMSAHFRPNLASEDLKTHLLNCSSAVFILLHYLWKNVGNILETLLQQTCISILIRQWRDCVDSS